MWVGLPLLLTILTIASISCISELMSSSVLVRGISVTHLRNMKPFVAKWSNAVSSVPMPS